MKKIFCLLILFSFMCSMVYGETDWRGLKNKSASEVIIEAIASYDLVFAKILKDPGLRSELKEKIEADGERKNVATILFDAAFGAILKNNPNVILDEIKTYSSPDDFNNLIGKALDWEGEGNKAVAILGDEFLLLLGEMIERFGESFFPGAIFDKKSDGDSKNDLPGEDDFTEVVFKAYRRGIISYSELESVWEKTKRIMIYLFPSVSHVFMAPMEKFYPEQYKEMFDKKLEDYINKSDEL